jgi:hypothetical protein
MQKRHTIFLLTGLIIFTWSAGCQKTYYAMWETLGKEKRHLLKTEVRKAAEDQEDASQQFQDTLTRIQTMYGFDGGDLEKMYKKLKDDFGECQSRADDVRTRIDNIEEIAQDLFIEWEQELNQISNPKFRSQSKKSLIATKTRYNRLQASLKKTEKSMEPVLRNLNDYVLFLKHNLNAQAIGALKSEADSIGVEVSSLIQDMNRSIREAEEFVKTLE